MPYDRQLIIQFLTGTPEDNLIKEKAVVLDQKAKGEGLASKIVTMPYTKGPKGFFTGVRTERNLLKVTANTRLYLQGHGCWQGQHLGRYSAKATADYLGPLLTEVKKISILGCSLGRDVGSGDDQLVTQTADSFASQFHARLKEAHDVKTVVTARVLPLGIMNREWLEELGRGDEEQVRQWSGRKCMLSVDSKGKVITVHKVKRSKLIFRWEDDRQIREWAY